MHRLLVFALFLGFSTAGEAALRAGAARRVITPDPQKHGPIYLAGFGQNRVAAGTHDDLYVRCLALAAGGRPVVLCGVDSIGLFWEDVQKIRQQASARIKGGADIVIAATHTHQAPDTMGLWGPKAGASGLNEAYNAFVVERAAEAAAAAATGMRRARIKLARDRSNELKGFINDTRPPVVNDHELIVLAALDRRGRPIGTLVNWANHPEALGSKNTLVTADYPATLYAKMETLFGGVSVFMNGAIGGMQSPLGAKYRDPRTREWTEPDSFRHAEVIGEKLAQLAVDALEVKRPVSVDSVEYREKVIEIPITNQGFVQAEAAGLYKGRKPRGPGGAAAAPVGYLRLSDGKRPVLEAALVPGELYPELSVGGVQKYPEADHAGAGVEPALKNLMTAPYRMLFGLANDEIGYIIPKAEWDEQAPWLNGAPRRWYGEVNSVGPEAAPRIAEAFADLARNAGRHPR
ncbi:MAG: hypothetical protein FJW40_15505 [Acidobacteria bacterium]|nr:hypothetical protein [Acidobacteriota bacterium]